MTKLLYHVRVCGTGRVALRSLLCAMAMLFAGCGSSKESLYELDHEAPAHWPTSLADAVIKIDERLSVSTSDPNYAASRKELLDLASWAAELTADTDMPEAEWVDVYQVSEIVRRHLNSPDLSIDDCRDDFKRLQALLSEAAEKYVRKPYLPEMPEEPLDVEESQSQGSFSGDRHVTEGEVVVESANASTAETAPVEPSTVEEK